MPAGPTDLLTDEVLAEQQAIAPLQDVSIDAVAEHGDRASVQVSYRLGFASGARRYRSVLHVVKRDSGWRLTTTVVATRIHVEQAVDRFNFAGTTAPSGPVLMFPGALPIRFDTPYLRVDPTTDSVQFAGPRRLDVRIEPTTAARHRVAARLRARTRGLRALGAHVHRLPAAVAEHDPGQPARSACRPCAASTRSPARRPARSRSAATRSSSAGTAR